MDTPNVVYKIENLITGDLYIGSTKRGFLWRKRRHLSGLERNNHHNRHLQNAYNFYGSHAFQFEILEIVDDSLILVDVEQRWITQVNPTYNVMKNIKSHIGCKRSDETRRKISESLKGKPLSDSHKESIRNTLFGSKLKEETKKKIGLSAKRSILQFDMNENLLREWPSTMEAAAALNLRKTCISRCLQGLRKSYHGFVWKRKFDI